MFQRLGPTEPGHLQRNLASETMPGDRAQRRLDSGSQAQNVAGRGFERRARRALRRPPMPAEVDQPRRPRRPRFNKPARDGFEILTPAQDTVEKCDGTLWRRTIEALECQLYTHR